MKIGMKLKLFSHPIPFQSYEYFYAFFKNLDCHWDVGASQLRVSTQVLGTMDMNFKVGPILHMLSVMWKSQFMSKKARHFILWFHYLYEKSIPTAVSYIYVERSGA